MVTFAKLADDGSTTSGDWIYVGSYTPKGNQMKRRMGISDPAKNDPTGMGFYPQWSWSWPLNRRIIYNRASADLNGNPWDPKRPGIKWNGAKWVGDVPDYPPAMSPHDPKAWLPFIMNGEGTGRLFSNTMRRRSASGTLRADGIAGAKRAPSERSKRSGRVLVR